MHAGCALYCNICSLRRNFIPHIRFAVFEPNCVFAVRAGGFEEQGMYLTLMWVDQIHGQVVRHSCSYNFLR
jgi:hypothetical protein